MKQIIYWELMMCNVFFFFLLLFVSVKSFAFGVDPWSYANYLQDLKTQINTALQAKRELMTIHNQVINMGTVSDYQWENIKQLIQQMDKASQQGQALSYRMSAIDADFRSRYPNYTNAQQKKQAYSTAYQQWNATTLDTLRNSLSALHIDASHLDGEEAALSRLESQGKNAKGRLQVLQVSTELAGENANQLMQLKRILMAQMNAESTYMAYQVSKDSYQEKSLATLVSHVKSKFPRYHSHAQFGVIQGAH